MLVFLACLIPVVPASAQSATSTVRVAICPTFSGVVNWTSWTPPAGVQVNVTRSQARRLAMYMGYGGYPRMIGPSNWSCLASEGADGNAVLEAVPSPYSTPRMSGRWEAARGLSVQVDPACLSCRLLLACPFFPSARKMYKDNYPGAKGCSPAPPAETLYTLSSYAVAFSDPPGVVGDGQPSGGPTTANGAAVFDPKGATAVATCALPDSQRWLCTVTLNQVIGDYRR
jgi:hypothetical protein